MQSLSWAEGVIGILTRPRLNAPAPHPCYIAMCTVKYLEASLSCLDPHDGIAAIALYREMCERSLSQFCGWKLTLDKPVLSDKSRLLYGFHEFSDALAWAIHTQNALLQAPWSADLAESPMAHTIFHRDDDRQWRELFAGLRVSIAVSRHTLTLRACLVCPPVTGSCCVFPGTIHLSCAHSFVCNAERFGRDVLLRYAVRAWVILKHF